MQSLLKDWHWENWGRNRKIIRYTEILTNIYIYASFLQLTTKKLDWPLDGTAEVCRARLSFSSINPIPFFVASATRQFRSRGPSGDISRLSTHSSTDVLRADGTHLGTLASWFRMVLSFSSKPLSHSRSPRKISLGHTWGCAIFSVACQKALGWRRLASKAMSPTGLLSSAIFLQPLHHCFSYLSYLISAISAWFFIPFQAESENTEPGSWRPDARSLRISAAVFFPRTHLGITTLGVHSEI